jgi:hypothetical protein
MTVGKGWIDCVRTAAAAAGQTTQHSGASLQASALLQCTSALHGAQLTLSEGLQAPRLQP